MTEHETFYLIHQDDENPDTFIHFDPYDEITVVKLSSPRYAIWDEDEQYHIEHSDDEDAIYELLESLRTEHDDEAGDRLYINDTRDYDMEPDWFDDGGFGSKYVRTDGWRGYTQVTHNDTWEEYAGGWVTGYPDEYTSYKMTAADLHNALYAGELEAPFPIVWFFGITSNVFSQTSDILIPAGRKTEFETWLAGVAGLDPEKVQHAFN